MGLGDPNNILYFIWSNVWVVSKLWTLNYYSTASYRPIAGGLRRLHCGSLNINIIIFISKFYSCEDKIWYWDTVWIFRLTIKKKVRLKCNIQIYEGKSLYYIIHVWMNVWNVPANLKPNKFQSGVSCRDSRMHCVETSKIFVKHYLICNILSVSETSFTCVSVARNVLQSRDLLLKI